MKKKLTIIVVVLLLLVAGSVLAAVPAYNDQQAEVRKEKTAQATALKLAQDEVTALKNQNTVLASKQALLCSTLTAKKIAPPSPESCIK